MHCEAAPFEKACAGMEFYTQLRNADVALRLWDGLTSRCIVIWLGYCILVLCIVPCLESSYFVCKYPLITRSAFYLYLFTSSCSASCCSASFSSCLFVSIASPTRSHSCRSLPRGAFCLFSHSLAPLARSISTHCASAAPQARRRRRWRTMWRTART
eukprot:2001813-Pleurochrysis_carterae.AAC.3